MDDSDPVTTNPGHYVEVFQNERVRVLEYHDEPGHRSAPHEHPDSVMVTLSSFDRRLGIDDRTVDVSLPAGAVRWLGSQRHWGENTGTTGTHCFFIELKEPPTTPTTGAGLLGPRAL